MRLSDKPVITRGQIEETVAIMARQISQDYESKEILLIAVLKGAAVFAVDLMRQLTVPVKIDFEYAKSYEGTSSNGVVEITTPHKKMSRGNMCLLSRISSILVERLRP